MIAATVTLGLQTSAIPRTQATRRDARRMKSAIRATPCSIAGREAA
jgi:hypothetical protein